MTLLVGPLDSVRALCVARQPARVVTILSPTQTAPVLPVKVPHLVLGFHDIDATRSGLVAPDANSLHRLLDFAAAWTEPAPMLVHCWMGISRSTAASFILACAADPNRSEAEIALALRAASPTATPNQRLIALADEVLARSGRMIAAIASIGRGATAACGAPFEFRVRPSQT
ncbi:tyrosine phosphatase family protein [Roseiterribacter gracilis]|uniref:Protein-tyrosine-phosphatase n=1 Tax=Roseiterribacter gracilis TaxID=2812848 RepID=A0A8S8X6V7_9PROT|nr:protein-tyrosine-phosphatase [Rhodospirillales bacterium TMPK1]